MKQKYRDLILGIITTVADAEARQELETALDNVSKERKNFAQAIRQILAGERDSEQSCVSR